MRPPTRGPRGRATQPSPKPSPHSHPLILLLSRLNLTTTFNLAHAQVREAIARRLMSFPHRSPPFSRLAADSGAVAIQSDQTTIEEFEL